MFGKAKLTKKDTLKYGIGAGVAQLAYIVLVVLIMLAMDNFLQGSSAYGGPLAMLLVLILLVFSAAVSGMIVFCYPAYLFLQKEYKAAVCTLVKTLATLLIGFLIILLVIFIQ